MRRLSPLAWLAVAVASSFLLGITYFVGMFSGGHEIDETCASVGRPMDDQYRAEHWREPGQWFPLRNKCDADHDLVPVWVNPAVVVLALLTGVCVVGSVGRCAKDLLPRRAGQKAACGSSTE
ncbi:hypothetical protein GCM10023084_69110 [Streptomyces lacrimifluminis]|uniref:Uncharacterized protein n=1 Tax=Streptomyces lacrimifluminis TaxID=1500077 RepID=A0A917P414_9ACTN|nr:hypothetical protein [Streptomyces lacrimifluminis]GGJ60552.1 hypothetical protein GCM10012282_67270 [Streptomyces lacrimifluminis]